MHWPAGGGRLAGWLAIRPQPDRDAIDVELSASLLPASEPILRRVRHSFDLDCEVEEVLRALPEGTPMHGPMRLIGSFDGFELAVRGVVGQQISVKAARTIVSRLVVRYGESLDDGPAGIDSVFPDPITLAAAPGEEIAALGVTVRRARTIRSVAQAVAGGTLRLEPGAPVAQALAALRAIPGIGDWTAQYIAMRALCWPDAFPAGDLAVLSALGVRTPAQALEKARAWRPWRAYAVMNLWSAAGLPSGLAFSKAAAPARTGAH